MNANARAFVGPEPSGTWCRRMSSADAGYAVIGNDDAWPSQNTGLAELVGAPSKGRQAARDLKWADNRCAHEEALPGSVLAHRERVGRSREGLLMIFSNADIDLSAFDSGGWHVTKPLMKSRSIGGFFKSTRCRICRGRSSGASSMCAARCVRVNCVSWHQRAKDRPRRRKR